jgi:phenylacetic acid degradation operon negative regulatory protein
MLQPQDLALTILGAYTREAGGNVWSGGMVELLGGFGFSNEAARAALARLAGRGLLERHREGRLVHYALTLRATRLLEAGDRRIFSFGRRPPTASRWTTLWHAIPEQRRVERARLAAQLRFLGFGSVQDATWIAAHDRERDLLATLRELDVEAFASVFVGRLSAGLAADALVAQAWDLKQVARLYERFAEELAPFRRATARRRLSDAEAFDVRVRALHRFRGFPSIDPELPDRMGGHERLRARVLATFDVVYDGLAEPAERHFEAIARTRLHIAG